VSNENHIRNCQFKLDLYSHEAYDALPCREASVMKNKHSFSVLIVLVTASILSAQSFQFLVKDAVDGHPLLINGGLGGPDSDGLEPAILVASGNVSDIYTAPGLARLSVPSFLKTGVYYVKLFSHYHKEEFCKLAASKQLKPEYVPACRSVRYRTCDLTVDTRQRKFQLGVPWPCLFLSVDGTPLWDASKPGFLPHGWISFDSLAPEDRDFLRVIDGITAVVQKIADSN